MTIYVVGGWMRSGTSMMMSALSAGGLRAVVSDVRERVARDRFDGGGYLGNPGGYYELTAPELAVFPQPEHEGCVAKLLRRQPLGLPAGDYRVVFMTRDVEEVRQSLNALMGTTMRPHMAERIERVRGEVLAELRARPDMAVTVLEYRDVVAAPLAAMERLVAAGWPIDAVKAAATVDPSLCRYRREELSEGV